jgi:alginate O-acetyltransferase complex protein AlgJ
MPFPGQASFLAPRARRPALIRLCLSGLLTLAALFWLRDFWAPYLITLTLAVQTDTPQTLRAFYQDGTRPGFSRQQSIQQSVNSTGRFARVRLDLPVRHLHGLRLDVGQRPGRVILKDLHLSPRGQLSAAALGRCSTENLASFVIRDGALILDFHAPHPAILFAPQDATVPAVRRVQPLLLFSIMSLAFLLICRLLSRTLSAQPAVLLPPPLLPGPVRPRSARAADGLFLLALAALMAFPASRIDTRSVLSRENRLLNRFPSLWIRNRPNPSFGPQFEAWFADRFRNRDPVIAAFNILRFRVNREMRNAHAFMGREAWLFGTAYGSVDMYRHANLFTTEELDLLDANLNQLNDWALKTGRKIFIHLSPDKESVYGEYYPAYYRKTGPRSRLQQVLDHVAERPAVWVHSPLDPLLAAKDAGQTVFAKSGTHMSPEGSLIEYQTLMTAISRHFPDIAPLTPTDFSVSMAVTRETDLLQALDLPEHMYGRHHLLYPHYRLKHKTAAEIRKKPLRGKAGPYGSQVVIRNDACRNARRALLVCDSFLGRVTPYLAENFRELTALTIGNGLDFHLHQQAGLVETLDPDLIIIGTTERFLDRLLRLQPPG